MTFKMERERERERESNNSAGNSVTADKLEEGQFVPSAATMCSSCRLRLSALVSTIDARLSLLPNGVLAYNTVYLSALEFSQILRADYTQDRPARSVSFGYSQDNAYQKPTNDNSYIFLEVNWQFAWVTSLISTNETTYESYG